MEEIINEKNVQQLSELLQEMIDDKLYQVIISNARDKEKITKVKYRPVMLKEGLVFQETAYIGKQVFHENYSKNIAMERITMYLKQDFRQCEIECISRKATVLVSKKGKVTITSKKSDEKVDKTDENIKRQNLSHNREKSYILKEGKPVPFLIDLGVQTPEGKIINAKYDKFKQINRFLEFIEDILPTLPSEREIKIIDFGCGKSYLTFAMYYYLKEMQGRKVSITGLDLKTEVIRHCNELAAKYGYDGLTFLQGDISTYKEDRNADTESTQIDMVVTLHACDTATDHALAKAVGWDAKVILSVPCCQHEVNKQIECRQLKPALKYGLIKERMSALLTDAIRANVLENNGYDVQILEFIDMEHTPKNILIRAVKKAGEMKKKETPVKDMTEFLGVDITLQKLLQ